MFDEKMVKHGKLFQKVEGWELFTLKTGHHATPLLCLKLLLDISEIQALKQS